MPTAASRSILTPKPAKRLAQTKTVNMVWPKRIQTVEAAGGDCFCLLFLFVPTPESYTFRKCVTRLELATSAVTV
jgi:hypothetical protein